VIRETTADPRFGASAHYTSLLRIETPAGRVRRLERERSAEVADDSPRFEPERLTSTTTVNGRTRERVFDSDRRAWTTTSPAGRETETIVDTQGRPTRTQSGPFAATERSYNDKGRLATVERRTDGRVRTTRYRYADSGPAAGTLRAVTDALGRTTTYTRDANGRIIEQTGPGGRSIGFGYDAEGRLTRVDPPGRPVHIMAYDGNGQRSAYDPPDIGLDEDVTRYRFNAAKQLTAIERPDGTRVSLRYNDGGQRVARTAEVGTWSYTYDADTGTLAGIEAPGGQRLAFERDGPLVTERRWSGSVTGRVTQQHDASFRVTQRTAAGRRIDRSYDADSLVTGAGALSVDRASDHAGVTATTLAAVTTSRSYNGFGELAARSATADGAGLYEVDYGRDASSPKPL